MFPNVAHGVRINVVALTWAVRRVCTPAKPALSTRQSSRSKRSLRVQ